MHKLAKTDDCQLLIPAHDEPAPELSIVIPALNEELTIGAFLNWCFEGIKKADIAAEVLIIDSSDDHTAQIALAAGARVLKVPRRGLGRAYIDALPYIRGKYVLMGDSDCTYDFREIAPFVEKFRQGYEFIMGSRFRGSMEANAMPPLHRYFGIPLTTFIYDLIYGQCFSDIHCGMRGITLDALKRMELQAQSWEYASEMIVKWSLLRLRVTEIPIKFYKDQEGRLSHHKRLGFLSPWLAGWINLKVMLTYGADFFLVKPGLVIAFIGATLMTFSFFAKYFYGDAYNAYNNAYSNENIFLLCLCTGAFLLNLGASFFYSGIIAEILYYLTDHASKKWLKWLAYDHSFTISIALSLIGLGLLVFSCYYSMTHNALSLYDKVYPIITAVSLFVLAFINFTSTLILHAMANMKAMRAYRHSK